LRRWLSEKPLRVLVYRLVVGRHHQNDLAERHPLGCGSDRASEFVRLLPPLSGQRTSGGLSDSHGVNQPRVAGHITTSSDRHRRAPSVCTGGVATHREQPTSWGAALGGPAPAAPPAGGAAQAFDLRGALRDPVFVGDQLPHRRAAGSRPADLPGRLQFMQQLEGASIAGAGLPGDRVRAQPRGGGGQQPLERLGPNRPPPERARVNGAARERVDRWRVSAFPPSRAAGTDSGARPAVTGPGGRGAGVSPRRAVRRRDGGATRSVTARPAARGATSCALAASSAPISAAISARRLSMAATSWGMSGIRREHETPGLQVSSATRQPCPTTA
jgi:hypothetical protein